ncbi:MAG: hypothetical protein GYA33_13145 [Thermogutta sp.]|nr:hypothetical protein [Thermogutta sp.]
MGKDDAVPAPRPKPPRALSEPERQEVLDVLHSQPFADKAPAEVYAALLDQGRYLCSIRTLYRILYEQHEVRERRDQLRHPAYHKPQLVADAPNQVWSWGITKLLGPAKRTSFCRTFFHWHNHEHHHWGLGLLTPATVHHGRAEAVLAARQAVLTAAHAAHPERFVRHPPRPLPREVWINPPADGLQPRTLQLPRDTNFVPRLSQTD